MSYASLCDDLLAAGEAALERAGVEPLGGQRAVVVGSLAWQCEGIFVWVTGLTLKGPLTPSPVPGQGSGCAVVPGLGISICLLRCLKEEAKIDWDTLDAEGHRTANDLAALSQEIISRWGAGTLFSGRDCESVSFTGFNVSRQGGMVGITATLVVSGSE